MEVTGGAASTPQREGEKAGGDGHGSCSADGHGAQQQQVEDPTTCVHDFGFVGNPRYNLNEEQLQAFKSINDSVLCPKRHINIVLGPSGTGKTRVTAATLLSLAKDRTAITCVADSAEAGELVQVLMEMGEISLKEQRFGRLSVLAKEYNMPKKISRFNVQSIANVYCHVFLFWRHFLTEVINHLKYYNDLYQYHLKKDENLVFGNFFKKKYSCASKDLMQCFNFIRQLPPSMFSGIEDNNIAVLIDQLGSMGAFLMDIDNDSLNAVLGISSLPEAESNQHTDRIAAAADLRILMSLCLQTMEAIKSSLKLKVFSTREEVTEYLLRESKIIICTLSSCSHLTTVVPQLNEKTGHNVDLVIVDVSSEIPTADLGILVSFPGIRNIVFTSTIKPQESIIFKEMSAMNTKWHILTQQYQRKANDVDYTNAKLQRSFKSLKWIGIARHFLPPIRDQGCSETCTWHSALSATETIYRVDAATDEPPRKYTIELCLKDMDKQYLILTTTKLGCETNKKKGKIRQENGLEVLKQLGVLGKGRFSTKEVPVAFRISLYETYCKKNANQVYKLLEAGNVMTGSFRISRNFFTMNPKKVYEFNDDDPIINPENKLVRSHAVMFVGVIPSASESDKSGSNLVYQNSVGNLFGESGFGVVKLSSVPWLYQPVL